MLKYPVEIREKVRKLRTQGFTYTEIQTTLGINIPKGSLNYMCKGILLNPKQRERVYDLMRKQLIETRKKALVANRKLLDDKIAGYKLANQGLSSLMQSRDAKLIALAMLYLGEGAKWKGRRGPMLGSSDPKIVQLYVKLLEDCYSIPLSDLRFRVQHRADQDPAELLAFWSNVTGAPLSNFYIPYVDKRTIGKTTEKTGYKGVCSVTCAGTHIQLELAEIADIISEAV